ncbi:hypothetical protein [Lacinutrix undariae]
MRKLAFILLLFSLHSTVSFSQGSQEKQMEEFKAKIEKDKNEFIDELVDNLNVDAFQEQIITQNLNSYFEKQQEIYALKLVSYAQKERFDLLKATHFDELKSLCSEEVIDHIKVALEDPIKYQKKNKKKRRNKKKN